jgi:hypothetical protein
MRIFLISSIGPMTRKARTGAKPKLERREAPIKASASLQSERRKAKIIKSRMAKRGVALIEVRIRVGT